MALAHCILGKFLVVGCHCFPPPLDVPISARCLHVQRRERPLAVEGGTFRGREMFRQISSRIRLPHNSRDLLHVANLRHGTDGFTSPPKEGVLRIFSPLKIRRLRLGYFVYNQFNIQKFCIPPTVCICFVWVSEKNSYHFRIQHCFYYRGGVCLVRGTTSLRIYKIIILSDYCRLPIPVLSSVILT